LTTVGIECCFFFFQKGRVRRALFFIFLKILSSLSLSSLLLLFALSSLAAPSSFLRVVAGRGEWG